MNKYDWLASESAPEGYPMKILYGTFLYPGEEEKGLYIPNLKLIYSGWGEPISTHVVGPDKKPLPDRIDITFYSYAEDQFYHGRFDLPYERIVQRFSEGYESNIEDQGKLGFRKITAGVAPGGHVAVWIIGPAKREEVLFEQAEPIEYDWEKFWRLSFGSGDIVPREEYRIDSLKASEAEIALEQAQNGTLPLDKWKRLRNQYPWEPRFYRLPEPSDRATIKYVNGEQYHLRPPYNTEEATAVQPMPKYLSFRAGSDLFLMHFDEDEMLEAFEAMADGDKRLYLDIAPYVPRTETQVRLRDEDDNIHTLEKFHVEELRKYD
ncbi:DUF2931 family protein [Marinimicrobium locisalis]|uniref:DUF2931 family protein n=1 Tax=Marinimicrobium locisalis TaxID=546022 RepID=UPI0032219778